ncbi:MFS transporter [Streptomyces spiroverticillatus]|uniref:MFS transporter n=1 Tax=Streptomyces finlayi TaxID=67296 RepID=A0A918WXR6_9ACTN|nr:MFS transporter [Streptomyces finlayi]GGZ91528.1 MFS transporter [Streptomyces spiroverticillatus]GHC93740.1 MFS transporter [Streptomyces finlayi]
MTTETTETTKRRPHVLRDRNAALFLSVVVVSGFGTTALWLTAGIWVKDLTGSDSLAALTTFCMWLPVLAGPLLGAVADRFRRRPLLVSVNLATALLLVSLVAVDTPDRVWILFVVLFLYGMAGTLTDAAESALVATAVDRSLLGDFNGLRMTAQEGTKLLAPLAGAALFTRFGGLPVALLDALTFALAAWLIVRLRLRVREDVKPQRTEGNWADGARHLWRSPVLRPLVLAASATMVLSGLNGAMIFTVVDKGLGRSPAYTGVLYAVQGAGTVLVGVLAGPLLRRMPERVLAAAGIALFAVSTAVRALPYDAAVLASSAGVGLGLPCVLIVALTAVQRETPDALLGRTSATATSLVYGPMTAAIALGSGLVAVLDHRWVLAGVGAAGAVTALGLGLAFGFRSTNRRTTAIT